MWQFQTCMFPRYRPFSKIATGSSCFAFVSCEEVFWIRYSYSSLCVWEQIHFCFYLYTHAAEPLVLKRYWYKCFNLCNCTHSPLVNGSESFNKLTMPGFGATSVNKIEKKVSDWLFKLLNQKTLHSLNMMTDSSALLYISFVVGGQTKHAAILTKPPCPPSRDLFSEPRMLASRSAIWERCLFFTGETYMCVNTRAERLLTSSGAIRVNSCSHRSDWMPQFCCAFLPHSHVLLFINSKMVTMRVCEYIQYYNAILCVLTN